MRQAVLGGFLGTALGVTVLSACGGSSGGVNSDAATIASLEARVVALEALLAPVSRDPSGDIAFTGVNVCIRNGLGSTHTTNGKGNLFVGYNEVINPWRRTGSHNVVVGRDHGYASTACLVTGESNQVEGLASAICGGHLNGTSGSYSAVIGGESCGTDTDGFSATVCGGYSNAAKAQYACVTGGVANWALGQGSAVSGGQENRATGVRSSVTGGRFNVASGYTSSVTGGTSNTASGSASIVLGGSGNAAAADGSVVP